MAELERIVGYRVDREISRSSIASVYQGYQESLQRKVLIKRLHPQFVGDSEIRARFEREAHALARIKHKNIVHIYDYRADDELMVLVQEWIGGGSVAELMRSNGPLEEREAIALAMDVLEGLEVAHEAGVIHRDIKPSNLMLSHTGSIKITDFGLAHFEGSPTLTQQGAIMGTPAYMAPEMVNGQPGSASCDLYSFGVTLYEVLTGENPFQAEHISQTLQRVLSVKPVKLEGVHDETNRILLSLMAKDPNQRPKTSSEVLAQLRPLARELGSEEGWETVEIPVPDASTNGEGSVVPLRSPETHTIRPVKRAAPSKRLVVAAWALMVLITAAVITFTMTNLFEGEEAGDVPPVDTTLALLDTDPGFDEGLEPEQPGSLTDQGSEDETTGDEGETGISPGGDAETEADQPPDQNEQQPTITQPENPSGEGESSNDGQSETEGSGNEATLPLDLEPPSTDPVFFNDSGYVQISVQPWAHVYYKDRLIGTTPLTGAVKLPSGRAQLALVNPQFPRVTRDFRVPTSADTASYTVDLYGEVGVVEFINATPWAEIILNGEYIGDTPLGRPILLLPGDHVLIFHHPDLKDEEQRFSIGAGERLSFRANLYD
ncbi:protein kinase [bacterium]|nr:protein kinase [bacterium]